MQSRAEVVELKQGDGVIFAVHHRPVQGTQQAVPGESASRGKPASLWPSKHARSHFSRWEMKARNGVRTPGTLTMLQPITKGTP
jgi:hypothetical protein